ncbi:MAG: acyl-CoA dehydratase activase [bacterium]
MYEYGIDIGSVSLKLAEFIDDKLTKIKYIKHHGEPYNLLYRVLKELSRIDSLVLTGSSTKHLCEILGAVYVNEVEATAQGVLNSYPQIRSIIEIGGEDSKLININDKMIKDFASNTICAAGTGIFLDQQARRLCYDIEDFGNVALRSKNPARIAGRCSVFAKSDMIHLQQIGTKPEDLMAGLCFALARNFKSVIAKGKTISKPVAFVGGVAANQGMIRAFQKVLEIPAKDLIVPDNYNCIGAIGAVLAIRKNNGKNSYKGLESFGEWLTRPRFVKRLAPLDGHKKWHAVTEFKPPIRRIRAYLGVDVGSISTNLVLIDEQGNVIARRYMWTKGRPIEIVLQGLKEIAQEIGTKVDIAGVGATGSGRYLSGEFIGADIIKNEISAQARAAIEIDPQVDTIFEIGGQDSKFISLCDKTIVDFEMNKVCAAGTGSFLEEQAEILGIELDNFGNIALDAKSPINLGERCTVFIGSEVIHHQGNISERENLLAGLGYSIVFNYLNRVVNGKKVGKKIFFQGGVAANKAVVSAFEQVLQKKITVPVNYDITGAIGIALLAREANPAQTKFRGFDLASRKYSSESFICGYCSNECEINKIVIKGENPIFYGGRCERYEEKKKCSSDLPDYFRMRNEIFFKTENIEGIEIGIPRSLAFYELFPFFYKFLTSLGFKPVLSAPTNRKIIEMGSEVSVADTCLPVKVALGHIRHLINSGINQVFLPSIISMSPKDENFTRCFVCPYVQTIPYISRAVFGNDIKVHSPSIYFDRGMAGVEGALIGFGKEFGKTANQVKNAIKQATAYQDEIQLTINAMGKQALADIKELAFVVCSRPYNGYDLGLNLDLPKKIRDLGVQALPIDFIQIDYSSLQEDFYNMYWHYGQRILGAAETISKNKNIFAIYLSNFACGPDSFLTRFFKEKLGHKPFLLMEVDEHSGDAGFITRCEAFYDSIKGARNTGISRIIKTKSEVRKDRTIYIPDMCDAAKVFAAAMRNAGIDAHVLPSPDVESVTLGRQYTSGKECLPAIITAGDMVKKINAPDFNSETSAFFMAQGSGPCRFGQYYKLHRIILDDLGLSEVPIYAPNQGPSLFDDLGKMGFKFLLSAWDGICAVDALEARSRMIRSYEIKIGNTDKIYDDALITVSNLIENGKSIVPYIKSVRKMLDAVEIHQAIVKPRIGLVGEIYVRSQKFSNNFMIAKLEKLGCEVVLPSIGEWFFYTNFTRVKNCLWFNQYRRAIFTKIFNQYMKWRQHKIYRILGLNPEADITLLLSFAKEYVHPSFEGETILTIGKTIECIHENFSGVVNIMPFTCMPGNIVTTLYKAIKDEYPDFPLFVLSLDGLEHAVEAMRLETFVSQTKNYQKGLVPR